MQGANFADNSFITDKHRVSLVVASLKQQTANKAYVSQKQKLHVQADLAEMLSVKLLSVKLCPLVNTTWTPKPRAQKTKP